MKIKSFCIFVLLAVTAVSSAVAAKKSVPWTIMIYGGVDSSAEAHIIPYLRSLAGLSSNGSNAEILLLYDRAPGHTEDVELFGENFEDTRLFRLGSGDWERISGGSHFPEITKTSVFEANTGDARTLAKFIQMSKANYPADKYMLIVFGHGHCQSVCPDSTSPNDRGHDSIYVSEMTDVLGVKESVDLIWFDVCGFGAIENAYQIRAGTVHFSAKAMLATPPNSSAAPMDLIFTKAGIFDKEMATPENGREFGKLMVRVTNQHLLKHNHGSSPRESWGCYDLTRVEPAKQALDKLAVALANSDAKGELEKLRGQFGHRPTMNYLGRARSNSESWVSSPHFDIYDLARRISESDDFDSQIKNLATTLMEKVDEVVLHSFGLSHYKGFEPGKNGLFIVFPDGDALFQGKSHWSFFKWYHPLRTNQSNSYGKLAWCADGAIPGNGVVENWFELLDSWYDNDDNAGGVNRYRW